MLGGQFDSSSSRLTESVASFMWFSIAKRASFPEPATTWSIIWVCCASETSSLPGCAIFKWRSTLTRA